MATQVFPSLELPPPVLARSQYTLEEFLGDVMRAESRITIVEVSKTRYQFSIGVCAAEYAQIMLNAVPRDTVAVESVDPDAVLKLVGDLGVSGANTSYIREIKSALRLSGHPSGLTIVWRENRMGKEIERKFLVKNNTWRGQDSGKRYRQGYLSTVKERTVRVRTAGDKAYLTIKGITVGASRNRIRV